MRPPRDWEHVLRFNQGLRFLGYGPTVATSASKSPEIPGRDTTDPDSKATALVLTDSDLSNALEQDYDGWLRRCQRCDHTFEHFGTRAKLCSECQPPAPAAGRMGVDQAMDRPAEVRMREMVTPLRHHE